MPSLDDACHDAVATGGFLTITRHDSHYLVLVFIPDTPGNVKLLTEVEFAHDLRKKAGEFPLPLMAGQTLKLAIFGKP